MKEVKHIITPSRKRPVMSIFTGQYRLATTSVSFFTKTHDYVISSMARQIRIEMKAICTVKCASLLRSSNESIQNQWY